MKYVSPSNYYYSPVRGINHDLKRHDEDIKRVKAKIAELEVSLREIDKYTLEAYRGFLSKLEHSRSLVASQIGKHDAKGRN